MHKTFVVILILLFVTRTFGAQTSPDDNKGVPACIEDQRTVLSIIWSCLATIFACTWLAVHPNVPGRNITTKGAISCAIERAKIMGITILVPELIVGWATEQFIVAWNLRHSEFLHDGTSDWETWYSPGTLVTLEALESEPNLVTNLAAISSETIEDKSKGDALSKTVSILQISWFIVQCIARAIQRLPLALLEMMALAFAGLSIMTYLLWWYKPLNMKYHISLDGSYSKPTSEMPDLEAPASPVNPSWTEWAYHRLFSVWEWIGLTLTGQRRSVDGRYEDIGDGAFRFYSGTTREVDARLIAMVGVGFLFGAFHCVAWSFYFPSHAEMVLWRFSSTAVLIGLFVGSYTDRRPWVLILNRFMVSAALVAYIVARIILIILAFLQLRSLPSFAFCTVQWTTYIPHI
ncbi:hypothetical protein EV421DRAFT_2064066, partial [Armillaria borealis]